MDADQSDKGDKKSLTAFASSEIHCNARTIKGLYLTEDMTEDMIEFIHTFDIPESSTEQTTTVGC